MEDKNRKRSIRRYQTAKRKIKAFKIFARHKKLNNKVTTAWANEGYPYGYVPIKSRYPSIGRYLKNDGKNCFTKDWTCCCKMDEWDINSKMYKHKKNNERMNVDYETWNNEDQENS